MANLLLAQPNAVTPADTFFEGRNNALLGRAISAPQDQRDGLLSQVASTDPKQALAFQGALTTQDNAAEDRTHQILVNMSRTLLTAPEQYRDQIYQQMKPALTKLGLSQVPDVYTPEVGQVAKSIADAWTPLSQQPSGLREIQGQISGAGLSGDEAKKAYRIALGIDPRAVTAAAKTGMITGADGRERPFQFNPATQSYKVFDGTTWRDLDQTEASQVGAPSQTTAATTQPAVTPEALMQQATQMANQGGPGANAQAAQAWLQQQLSANGFMPSPANGTGALGVGRAPEDTAGAVQNAKNASDLAYLPRTEGIKADVAVDEAARKAAAEANIKSGVDRNALARANATALSVWSTAMGNLESSLNNTNTGPVSGRLPAVTANQQIAEGAVAQMAPVLKQLFRTAGEGTFTDKDQDLLLKMLPDRADHPAAREAKIKAIDALVKAKLQTQPVTPVSAASGQATAQHPIPQTQADFDALPPGALYVDPDDGKTYRKP